MHKIASRSDFEGCAHSALESMISLRFQMMAFFSRIFRTAMIALILLLSISSSGLAQDYLYDTWGIGEGLPQSSVNQILQTSDGYIWVATEGGLARFDGVQFTIYNTDNTSALMSNRINGLFENTNGDLLIGHTEGGLVVYRNNRFLNMSDSLGYPFYGYYSFWFDAEGRIHSKIALTSEMKIHDPITYQLLEDNRTISHSKVFKSFTIGGFDYYFYRDSIARYAHSGSDEKPETISVSVKEAMVGQGADDFWILTGRELCQYVNLEKIKCFDIQEEAFQDKAYRLFSSAKGKIYIGIYQSVVLVFDISTSSFSVLKFGEICEDGRMEDVYEDREGNIWYSTSTCGLIKQRPDRFTYIGESNLSKGGNTYPIAIGSDKMIWVSTREKGIFLYDSLFNELPLPESFQKKGFSQSIESYNGDFYFYFMRSVGIVKWNGKKQEYIYFPDSAKNPTDALYASKSEGLLVGTSTGILRLNNHEELEAYPLSDSLNLRDIVNIYEDMQGLLWVVSNAEIICFDLSIQEVKYRFGQEHETKPFYRGIGEDEDGRIYVGSYGNGLMVIQNGDLKRFSTDHGLAENVVSSITSDGNGNIWLTGNRGLSRIVKEEVAAIHDGSLDILNVILYDEQTDGLRTGEFNGGNNQSKAHLGENRYLFPTMKGVVYVDFDRMDFNELPPPVHVEKLLYADSTILVQDQVSLPYSEGRLEIYYTALSFTSPKNVRFKYRLEGYETNWTYARAERKTSYSKIPPGMYTFQVVASNNEGVWNEEGDSLIINIVPPFYMTAWFRLLLVLAGVISVGLVTYAIIRRNKNQLIEKQRSRLEAIVNTEERERQRIAKDLHDGVGQLLSSVKMNLTNTESKLGNEQAIQMLDQSKRDIDQIATELRNISYNLLPSSLEKFGLATAIEEQIKKLEDADNISLHFTNSVEQDRFDPQVEIMLYRLFQEMLNNTLKHAQASEITVQLLQYGKELQLMFEDNGKGFNLKSGLEQAGSSGLKNLYSRVALINGKISIDSHPSSGTIIIVEVNL